MFVIWKNISDLLLAHRNSRVEDPPSPFCSLGSRVFSPTSSDDLFQGFNWVWCIQVSTPATLTVVGEERMTEYCPSQFRSKVGEAEGIVLTSTRSLGSKRVISGPLLTLSDSLHMSFWNSCKPATYFTSPGVSWSTSRSFFKKGCPYSISEGLKPEVLGVFLILIGQGEVVLFKAGEFPVTACVSVS